MRFSDPTSVCLVVIAHLLFTGVLTALALLLSVRFPYRETTTWFRITLALLAASAVAVTPLLGASNFSFLWLPFLVFGVALLAFLVFSARVIRSHFDRLRR